MMETQVRFCYFLLLNSLIDQPFIPPDQFDSVKESWR